MQLILTKDVAHLGSLGDQVQVKNGYARNYLIPQGMAIVATAKNAGHVAHRRKQLDLLRQEAIIAAQSEAEKVGALELEIKAKAGRNGRLFGSVTNRQVQIALEEKGYSVDRRSVQLHAPIKAVGTYTVTVKLHTDVKTDISVKVTPINLSEGELQAQSDAAEEDTASAAGGDAPAEGEAATAEESAASAPEGETPAEGDAAAAPEQSAQQPAAAVPAETGDATPAPAEPAEPGESTPGA